MKSTITLEKDTIAKLAIRGNKGDSFEKILSELLNQMDEL